MSYIMPYSLFFAINVTLAEAAAVQKTVPLRGVTNETVKELFVG